MTDPSRSVGVSRRNPGNLPLQGATPVVNWVYYQVMTKTCTIQFATGLCGAPAVTSFVGRDGKTYFECARHAAAGSPAISTSVSVGDRVSVVHGGIEKVGRVVKVGRVRCEVEVPIGSGRSASSKVIVRQIEDVEAVR